MKTSTIIKISTAIFLCIIFLALIGRKSRERFENFQNMNNTSSYGNANPAESPSREINDSGYSISYEDDNNISNLNLNKRHELPTNRFCTISNKTNEERNMAIQQEAMEAKRQLNEHLKRKLQAKERANPSQPPSDPCTYLRFPAILS